MWETETLPKNHNIDLAQVVVVPCEHNVRAFRRYLRKGQTLKKCNLGVTGTYTLPNSDGFRFVSISADHGVPQRKKAQAIVNAFTRAFPTQRDVELILKQNDNCAPLHCFDSRISLIKKSIPSQDMLKLIQSATVGVQASCMEGWGLPHNQFIANGRPVITPIFSGPADFLTKECTYRVRHKVADISANIAGYTGRAAFVDEDDLAKQMLYAYENPLTVTKKSVAAFERAQKFTEATMTTRWLQIVRESL